SPAFPLRADRRRLRDAHEPAAFASAGLSAIPGPDVCYGGLPTCFPSAFLSFNTPATSLDDRGLRVLRPFPFPNRDIRSGAYGIDMAEARPKSMLIGRRFHDVPTTGLTDASVSGIRAIRT